MKIKILVIIVLLFVSSSFAQVHIQKGSLNIAGSMSYSVMSNDELDDDVCTLHIKPQAYYLLTNNIALGGTLGYRRTSCGDQVSNAIILGPGVKVFFRTGNVYPFVALAYDYIRTTADDTKLTDTDLNIRGGIDFFIAKNVAIEPYVQYTIKKHNHTNEVHGIDSDSDAKIFVIGVGISTFINP